MARSRVEVVLDVGANVGEYGLAVRGEGFAGSIHSFEPLADAFITLQEASRSDLRWESHQLALGANPGIQLMHRSENIVSSSFLDVAAVCIAQDPTTRSNQDEEVQVETLARLANRLPDARTWLKLDVQGYELEVLAGAGSYLNRVIAVECEMSTVALYEDQPLIEDVIRFLRRQGFALTALKPGVMQPGTSNILQLDGIFERLSDENLTYTSPERV